MALENYIAAYADKTNICFRCKNACGGCSWSELDPDTLKPRFEPVPGWTAKKVMLNVGTNRKGRCFVETYQITGCPLFVKDDRRTDNFKGLTDSQWAELMKKWRIWGWI